MRKFSLNRMIIWIIVVGYALVITLLLILDGVLVQNFRADGRQATESALEKRVKEIEQAMEEIDDMMYQIWLYDENFDQLSRSSYHNGEFIEELYELSEDLKNFLSVSEDFDGYFIYYDGEENCRYGTDLLAISAAESTQLSSILAAYSQDLPESIENGEEEHWIAVSLEGTPVLAVRYHKDRATIFAVHSLGDSKTLLEELGEEARVICYGEGMYLSGEEAGQALGVEELLKEQKTQYYEKRNGYWLCGQKIQEANLYLLAAVPAAFWDYVSIGMLFLLVAEIFFGLCLLWAVKFIRQQVVYPLRDLTDQMNEIRSGREQAVLCRDYAITELRVVEETLNQMISELREQKMKTYENIIARQKAAMQYFQLQLKPHFYLNGLKTLQALAQKQDTRKMEELIFLLADNIRYLMSSNSETVTLKEELDFCEKYIELRRCTTDLEIGYQVSMEELSEQTEVPVLCIQTFLENSCKYARSAAAGRKELELQVSIHKLMVKGQLFLDIIIEDNGTGYPDRVLEQIKRPLSLIPEKNEENIGINNIRRRCLLLYGEEAEISFYNADGAVSNLLLPARRG